MSRLRVLFSPSEVSGVATAMRDGLRARDVDADLWLTQPHPFVPSHDRLLPGYVTRAAAGLAAPLRYDVLHYQFGTTLAEFIDAAWGRIAGRPLRLMHYWGDDCRIRTGGGLMPLGADSAWERQQIALEKVIRRRLRLAGRLCDAALVPDLELAAHVKPFFRTVYVVAMPVALPLTPGAPSTQLFGDGPVVFHAPSHRLIKGTPTILAAMDSVAKRRPLQPVAVSGVPHRTVLGELARADIVIDQLNQQTSGVFALEAMALGKPVLTELRRDLLAPFARDAPLIPVTADTLEAELEALAADPERRASVGRAGPEYVARVHDAGAVAELLEAIYLDARARRAGVFEVTPAGIRPLPSAPT
jgi:hypothetical protein